MSEPQQGLRAPTSVPEQQFWVKNQHLTLCFSPPGLALGPLPDAKKPKLMHGTLLMKDNVSERVLVLVSSEGVNLCPLRVFSVL